MTLDFMIICFKEDKAQRGCVNLFSLGGLFKLGEVHPAMLSLAPATLTASHQTWSGVCPFSGIATTGHVYGVTIKDGNNLEFSVSPCKSGDFSPVSSCQFTLWKLVLL